MNSNSCDEMPGLPCVTCCLLIFCLILYVEYHKCEVHLSFNSFFLKPG